MKVTYDKVANAAYIYFGNSPVSFTYSCDPVELRGEMINLDFDIEGHLVGIEILNASKVLGSGDTILNSDETRREGRGESEQEPKKEKEGGKDGGK